MAGFADIALPAGIAERLALGDVAAQAEVYRQVAPPMLGLAVRVLSDRSAAQEVVQDTFVQMLEHAAELREPRALVGWLRRVAVNECLMRLRSPWHSRRVEPLNQGSEEAAGRLLDGDDQARAALTMERTPDIEQALGRLSAEARLVVWLHDVEGYTHKEIGEQLGKTASFSKSQLARAYLKLEAWYQLEEPNADERQNKATNATNATNDGRPACAP